MKLTTAIATALVIAATAASAGTRIERTNIATVDGRSVDGFKLFGYGITPFVEAKFADLDFVADDVVILPADVSAENLDQVEAYLTSIGITGYDVVCHDKGGDAVYDGVTGERISGRSADLCRW